MQNEIKPSGINRQLGFLKAVSKPKALLSQRRDILNVQHRRLVGDPVARTQPEKAAKRIQTSQTADFSASVLFWQRCQNPDVVHSHQIGTDNTDVLSRAIDLEFQLGSVCFCGDSRRGAIRICSERQLGPLKPIL